MSNQIHSNPILSVISGAFGGLYAFFQNYGFEITDFLELLKVISFGLIGGACGYVGKFLAIRVHKYMKDKSKKVCK